VPSTSQALAVGEGDWDVLLADLTEMVTTF
jgi:hypothetical protein